MWSELHVIIGNFADFDRVFIGEIFNVDVIFDSDFDRLLCFDLELLSIVPIISDFFGSERVSRGGSFFNSRIFDLVLYEKLSFNASFTIT